MKVTKINPNTFSVQLDPETEPAVVTRRGPAAKFINCGTEEAQRYLWDHLEHLAERPSFEDQLFDPSLVERIEALESNHVTLKGNILGMIDILKEGIDEKIADLELDAKMHGTRIEDLENAAETAEPATIDEDQLHDAIATYVIAKPNVLRRAILDIITDKLC